MPAPGNQIMLVGGVGGTNVADSLARAAVELGHEPILENHADAMSSSRLAQGLLWRLGGRRPFYLSRFSRRVLEICSARKVRILIATGTAPLHCRALEELRALGVFCVNYSTDDPWNSGQRAGWFLRALPRYNVVFTPRRANVEDFRSLGCAEVRYLPFAFAPDLFSPPLPARIGGELPREALFVGGADDDRVRFFGDCIEAGLRPSLVGDYWDRYPRTRPFAAGRLDPTELVRVTANAVVNICLVRRANRDGHVMRSFEIPAVGGFMVAEDTDEHRALFGADGERVCYFRSPAEAVERTRWAYSHPEERARMAASALALVTGGGHTYRDRLKLMLEAARE